MFDKIDGFIKTHNGFRCLILFDYGWFNKIYNKIISEKSGITDSINHNFAKIRINSYDSLHIEKVFTFHNVTVLIKSIANRDKNNYYCNIFLEKGLYKNKSNTKYF